MKLTLDQTSLLCLYSAMAVYAIAVIAFAMNLSARAGRSGATGETDVTLVGVVRDSARALVSNVSDARGNLTDRRGIAVLERDTATLEKPDLEPLKTAQIGTTPGARSLRVGTSMLVLGWLLHLVATVLRGFAAGRVPWSNMYEFTMTGTLVMMTVFLAVLIILRRNDLRYLGVFMSGLVTIFLGLGAVNFYVSPVPLPPALQSYWLVIHVFVATAAVGCFSVGFALSLLQILQQQRESALSSRGSGVVASGEAVEIGQVKPISSLRRIMSSLPKSEALENLAYRINIVGFILWTFTLMAGAIWAERAWGRYWGWDTKEVWTFIIWVVWAGYIHARATRGWRGSRASWLAVIGFTAIIFNFTIVNLFFKGLHVYSGL